MSGFSFPSSNSGGNPFGAKSDAPSNQTTASSATPSSLFGAAPSSGGGGLFGGSKPATGNSFTFGKPAETNSQSSAPASGVSLFGGASTPAPNKTLFGTGSTTPAATPPANAPQPSLFGKPATTSSSGGLGLFGSAKPATTASPLSSSPAFSFPTTSGAQSTPNNTTATGTNPASSSAPTPSLFGNRPASSSTPAANTTKPLFGAIPSTTPGAAPTSSLFQAQQEQTSAAATPATTAPSTSGFSLFQKPSGTPAQATPTSSATQPGAGGFALGQKSTPATQPQSTATASTAPMATTSASTGGFGLFKTASTTAPTASAAPTTATTTASTSALGSLGPVSQQPAASRLKNKSMDEILTRWATDLTKYQTTFKKQAEQIAEWDKLLLENTDTLSKLVTKTMQAERDASEVEKQLSLVESQQDELSQWLDKYDKEIDDMIQKVGLTGDVAGVDVERERTFKLAEKLADRIEGCNKDLTEMIEEINTVSSMLSNASGGDDPLSHVVRVLNSHLSQLQRIDIDATKLQSQVQEAQKQLRASGNNDWRIGTNSADEFYKTMRR